MSLQPDSFITNNNNRGRFYPLLYVVVGSAASGLI